MIKREELKIGKLMTAYNTHNDLEVFELRDSNSNYLGKSKITNVGERYTILGNLDKRSTGGDHPHFLIMFKDSTKLIVTLPCILQGKIKNPHTPSLHGVGFPGQGIYGSGSHPKEYRVWVGMFQRCYDKRSLERNPSYKGCNVTKRWHNFQNFCEDILKLKGYKEWKENLLPRAYALDKDIKIEGNKIYSKEACMFVTTKTNSSKSRQRV